MKIKEEEIPGFIKRGLDKEVVPLLYKNVLPVVQKFVLRNRGSKDDAFDAFQDALLSFYKQVVKGTFDPKYKVYGYLYRLSINFWLNKIKRDKRYVYDIDLTGEEILDDNVQIEDVNFVNTTEENILRKFFSSIGDKCVEILTYVIYQNLLLEDIAIRMELSSVDACKMQVMRCKKKMLQMMEENPILLQKLKRK